MSAPDGPIVGPMKLAIRDIALPVSQIMFIAGDLGGFMGLLLGASVLTLCELFDFLIYNCFRKIRNRRRVSSESMAEEK